MGGPGAPDGLDAKRRTQVWLAVSDDAAARVSGKYFYHLRPRSPHPAMFEVDVRKNYSMHATASLAFVYRRERRHSSRQSQCNRYVRCAAKPPFYPLDYGDA
jgi:hypothetical protein